MRHGRTLPRENGNRGGHHPERSGAELPPQKAVQHPRREERDSDRTQRVRGGRAEEGRGLADPSRPAGREHAADGDEREGDLGETQVREETQGVVQDAHRRAAHGEHDGQPRPQERVDRHRVEHRQDEVETPQRATDGHRVAGPQDELVSGNERGAADGACSGDRRAP